MAGLYIHIPFCKQACSYCNFHFSTRLNGVDPMVEALTQEIRLRHSFLDQSPLESIYFGGGTPSVLTDRQLLKILNTIDQYFEVSEQAEITLEANPDDLTTEKLAALRDSPVNRLSIGIQSFRDQDLQLMNRVHSARQAHLCIESARKANFENLTIDLIYGIPDLSEQAWKNNLDFVRHYSIKHFSSYALTVEPKTLLAHQIATRKISAVTDERMAGHFRLLIEFAREHNFLHYEISNFAKRGFTAIHNSNYWRQKKYLGIGPSAHSFNRDSRSWNISNNAKYLKAISENNLPLTVEELTAEQKYNEYVMTGLRTMWGCDRHYIRNLDVSFWEYFRKEIEIFLKREWIREDLGIFTLTDEGKLFADHIASELFLVE
ncbi:MAG: radical SAM family heme chaperone HemW [Saprospiraceae bacterium]|nr:radical SAM family heme chaperone HemW [Saprospiraceae bacterium]